MTTFLARLLCQGLVAAVAVTSSAATGKASESLCFRGINLSGAEYGDRGGTIDVDYTYPSENTVKYFAAKGMNTVRLPFKWERLQPTLNQPLDKDELKRLKDAVDRIHDNHMAVILDPHNYAQYDKKTIPQTPVTDLAFGDFWARLSAEFSNDPGVIFGLMNEPFDIKATDWLEAANTAIRSIRTVGANNLVLVPGTSWTGAWSWNVDRLGGGANGTVMLGVKDPRNNYAYEFHQYFDADASGTHPTCEGATQALGGMTDVTAWLRQNNKKGFLGEFGVAGNQPCLDGLQKMLDVMGKNGDVWLGWSYWSAGDWWPDGEPLNVQPRKSPERPQMKLLETAARKQKMPQACSTISE